MRGDGVSHSLSKSEGGQGSVFQPKGLVRGRGVVRAEEENRVSFRDKIVVLFCECSCMRRLDGSKPILKETRACEATLSLLFLTGLTSGSEDSSALLQGERFAAIYFLDAT